MSALALPTEKSSTTLTPETAKVLLYGAPKVGKTTLAASIDPDRTLFVATEPGHGAMEIFKVPVSSWEEFRQVGPLLAADKGERFTTVVIDTIDELAKQCQDKVMVDMGGTHPSEFEYGKGWNAVATEFKLRVGALCSLGLGVWFVSHAKEEEVKKRVGSITVYRPDAPTSARKFLTGFCDWILYAEVIQGDDGEQRVLRTQPAENHEAGGRIPEGRPPLPDPLPLDAAALREAMAASYGTAREPDTQTTDDQPAEGKGA